MKKNVIFVIVFAAVIVGLVQLHKYSQKEIADAARLAAVTDVNGIADLTCPSAVEERSDIPFEKLIDPESRKLIPDSVNVEAFRPHKIFLAKGFDAGDADLLKNFSNIIVNANTINGFNADNLTDETIAQISESVKASIEQSASHTSYRISEWTASPLAESNGSKVLQYKYIQNNNENKSTYMILTYLFKGDKQVEVMLASTGEDYSKWISINNELVKSIVIK